MFTLFSIINQKLQKYSIQISQQMSLRLSINHQFLDELCKRVLHSNNNLKTTIESHSIPIHELSFDNLIQM